MTPLAWRYRLPSLARLGASLVVFTLTTNGCASVASTRGEPLRVGTVEDLSGEALGLRVGETTLEEARARLRARGLTGVVDDAFAGDAGPTVSVLAADYQSRVFVFREGRFVASLDLPTHGLPPYDLALRLAYDGSARGLLVLYRDPLERPAEPPTMLLFHLRDAGPGFGFELAGRASLDGLVARHHGLARPLFVGNDLGDGVMLVARDRGGALWDTSYLVRPAATALALQPRAMSDALRCSCVQRYADGAPKR